MCLVATVLVPFVGTNQNVHPKFLSPKGRQFIDCMLCDGPTDTLGGGLASCV